ncbi:MAG: hypothetical protein ACXVHX_32940 [Solirubrobacteraceae bacterium]
MASDIPGGHAGELGRPAEARAAYQQVIDRYGEDPAPPCARGSSERLLPLQTSADAGRSD